MLGVIKRFNRQNRVFFLLALVIFSITTFSFGEEPTETENLPPDNPVLLPEKEEGATTTPHEELPAEANEVNSVPSPILPSIETEIRNRLHLVLIDDQVSGNQYVSTLGSTGMSLKGAQTGVIFGTRYIKDRNKQGVIWYPHSPQQDIERIIAVEPMSAFRGVGDFRGGQIEGNPSAIELPSTDFSNLLMSDEAFSHFHAMGVGGQQILKVSQSLQEGAQREIQSEVVKQAQIVLRRPSESKCQRETLEAEQGWRCIIREVNAEFLDTSTGDLQFIIRLKAENTQVRYRVGSQWHAVGMPVSLAEFAHSNRIELFLPSQLFEGQTKDFLLNNNRIDSAIEAGFYSSSRHSQGDRFAISLGKSSLSGETTRYQMSRLEVLLIEDLERASQYITTLTYSGSQENRESRVFGVRQPGKGEYPAIWYLGHEASQQEIRPSPEASFLPVEKQRDSEALILSEQGWQQLAGMAAGEALLWRYERGGRGESQVVMSNIQKAGQLQLRKPAGQTCQNESIDGLSGQVCVMREVQWQGQPTLNSELRFTVKGVPSHASARYRVHERWVPLGESISVQDFKLSQKIELFYPLVAQNQAESSEQEEDAGGAGSFQMTFFMPGKKVPGDHFTLQYGKVAHKNVLPGTKPTTIPLVFIEDRPSQRYFVTSMNSEGYVNRQSVLFGAEQPKSGERLAAWYVMGMTKGVERDATQLSPQGFFEGWINIQGKSSTQQEDQVPVLSAEAWQEWKQMPLGGARILAYRAEQQKEMRSLAIKSAELLLSEADKNTCAQGSANGLSGWICPLRRLSWKGGMPPVGLQLKLHAQGEKQSDALYRVAEEWYPLETAIPLSEVTGGQALELFIPAAGTKTRGEEEAKKQLTMPSLMEVVLFSSSRVSSEDKFVIPITDIVLPVSQSADKEALNIEQFASKEQGVKPGQTLNFTISLNRLAEGQEKVFLKLERIREFQSLLDNSADAAYSGPIPSPKTSVFPEHARPAEQDLALDKVTWQGREISLKEDVWIALPLAQVQQEKELTLSIPVLKEAKEGAFTLSLSREAPALLQGRTLQSRATQEDSSVKKVQVYVYQSPEIINTGDGNNGASWSEGYQFISSMKYTDSRSSLILEGDMNGNTLLPSGYWEWTSNRKSKIGLMVFPDNCFKNNINPDFSYFYRSYKSSPRVSKWREISSILYFLEPTPVGDEKLSVTHFAFHLFKLPDEKMKGGECTFRVGFATEDPKNSDYSVSSTAWVTVNFDKQDYLFLPKYQGKVNISSGETFQAKYNLRRATNSKDTLKFEFFPFPFDGIGQPLQKEDVQLDKITWLAEGKNCSACPMEIPHDPVVLFKPNTLKPPVGTETITLTIPFNPFTGTDERVFSIFTGENDKTGFANPGLIIAPKTEGWISGFEKDTVEVVEGESLVFKAMMDMASVKGQVLTLQLSADSVPPTALDYPQAKVVIGGQEYPVNFKQNTTQTVNLPLGTKEILIKLPTLVQEIAESRQVSLTLSASTGSDSTKKKTASGVIYPRLTPVVWSSGTQDSSVLEVLGEPEQPWLSSRIVQLGMKIDPSLASIVDFKNIAVVGKGISPDLLDLSEQQKGELILAPVNRFSLKIPRKPLYLYAEKGTDLSITVKSYHSGGQTSETSLPLTSQPIPLLSPIQAQDAPWGRDLRFTLTPQALSPEGATMTLKVLGAQTDDIDWSRASLSGQNIPPQWVGDLSVASGKRVDITQPISSPLVLTLPTQQTEKKLDRVITLQAEGGLTLGNTPASGSAAIKANLFYVTEVTGQGAKRGGNIEFTVHLSQLPKRGEKLYFKLAFPGGKLSLADLDLNQVRVKGEGWSTAKPLVWVKDEAVISLQDGELANDVLKVSVPVLYPSGGATVKGGTLSLFAAAGDTYNDVFGAQAEAQIESLTSSLQILDNDGAKTPIQLSGDMDVHKELRAARQIRWKVENVAEGEVQEQLLMRAIRERSGIQVVWSGGEASASNTACLFKVVKGKPLDAYVAFPAFMAFNRQGKNHLQPHNCAANTPVDLRESDWLLTRDNASKGWEAKLPFELIFKLDTPQSQFTQEGAVWLGQAELNMTMSVQSIWNG